MIKILLLEFANHAGRLCVVSAAFVLYPALAYADAIWPPAVYYYTLAVWWVVAGGLIVEFILHLLVLRMAILPLVRTVVLTNLASALIGLVLTWPLVFWEVGVTRLATMAPLSIFATLAVIFVVNTVIEYVVAVRWLRVQKRKTAIASFLLANAASYGLVVWVSVSGILSGT